MDNMFEKASRMKLRFHATAGIYNVEDLWELNLESLDEVGIALKKSISEIATTDSLIPSKATRMSLDHEELNLKFAIVKHVVDVRLEEMEATKAATVKAARKQEILALIKEKQGDELKAKSAEELQAMLDEI